jgi:hypothetical protein
MYYVARWYDPHIAHFVQADTIVPGAGNPAAWDRYGYVLNNPMTYVDPSGHWPVGDDVDIDNYSQSDVDYWISKIHSDFPNIHIVTDPNFDGKLSLDVIVPWSSRELRIIYETLCWFPYIEYLTETDIYIYNFEIEDPFTQNQVSGTPFTSIQEGMTIIGMGDDAWHIPYTYGIFSLPNQLLPTESNYSSSFFHELMHAAIGADRNKWSSQLNNVIQQQNNPITRTINWLTYYGLYNLDRYDDISTITGKPIWENPEERKAEEILIFQTTLFWYNLRYFEEYYR